MTLFKGGGDAAADACPARRGDQPVGLERGWGGDFVSEILFLGPTIKLKPILITVGSQSTLSFSFSCFWDVTAEHGQLLSISYRFQGRELLGDTDGDGVSMAANGGLTDAEGALSDVNSIYECGGGEAGDLDDTSLSSRASSRFCIFKTRCSPN